MKDRQYSTHAQSASKQIIDIVQISGQYLFLDRFKETENS